MCLFLRLFGIYVLTTVGRKTPRTTQALTSLAATAAAAASAHAAARRAAAIATTTFRESETKSGVREHSAFGVFKSEHGQEPDLSVRRPTLFDSET